MPTLWTVADVARRLTVPASWVYAQAEAGTLPSLKIGHYRRFEPEAIEAWVQQRRVVRSALTDTTKPQAHKDFQIAVGVRPQRHTLKPPSPRRQTSGLVTSRIETDDGPHAD
jgi:excisionase family DNA binding protein